MTLPIKQIELVKPKMPFTIDDTDAYIRRIANKIEFYPAIWAKPKPLLGFDKQRLWEVLQVDRPLIRRNSR